MKFERIEYLWNLRGSSILHNVFQSEKERENEKLKKPALGDVEKEFEPDHERHKKVGVQSGHVFLSVRDNRVLLSLEAVPTSRQLTDTQLHQLSSMLMSVPSTPLERELSLEKERLPLGVKEKEKTFPFVHRERERGKDNANDKAGKNAGGKGNQLSRSDSDRTNSPLQGLLFSAHAASPIVHFQLFERTSKSEVPVDQTLVLLRSNSIFEIWQYSKAAYQWTKLSEVRLSLREITLSEASFISTSDELIVVAYSEVYLNKMGSKVCDVYVQAVEIHDTPHIIEVVVAEPEKLLIEVPHVNIVSMRGGFALIPKQRRYNTLRQVQDEGDFEVCYFWSPKSRTVFSLVWGVPYKERPGNLAFPTVAGPAGTMLSTMNVAKKHDISSDLWKTETDEIMTENPTTADNSGGSPNSSTPNSGKASKSNSNSNSKGGLSTKIVSFSVHPVTKELLVLEKCGDVVVCSLESGTLAMKKFCHLHFQNPSTNTKEEDITGDGEYIVRFGMQRLNMIIFTPQECLMFNIRSGKQTHTMGYPFLLETSFHVWSNQSVGGNLGVWNLEGIWQLQHHRVTDDFAEISPVNQAKSPEDKLDDIFMAQYWALKRHQAKFALDLAQKLIKKKEKEDFGVEEEVTEPESLDTDLIDNMYGDFEKTNNTQAQKPNQKKGNNSGNKSSLSFEQNMPSSNWEIEEDMASVAAARFLLTSNLLESPALPVAILSSHVHHQQAILTAIKGFLKDYYGDKSAEKDPAKSLKAFYLRTPLNEILKPLMESYVSVSELHSSNASTWASTYARDFEMLLMVKNHADEVVKLLKRTAFSVKQGKQNAIDEDRARFETLFRQHPDIVLGLCEEFLRLPKFEDYSEEALASVIPEGELLNSLYLYFSEESVSEMTLEGSDIVRSPRHPMFEIMCTIYALQAPINIPKFIIFAHYCQVKFINTQSRSGYSSHKPVTRKDKIRSLEQFRQRAIRTILPPNPQDVSASKDPSNLTAVIVSLLSSVHEKSRALKFLLSLNQWDEGIVLVGSLMDKEVVDHFELFHTLLTFYLDSLTLSSSSNPTSSQSSTKDFYSQFNSFAPALGFSITSSTPIPAPPPNILEKIWQVMPRNYSIYELLAILKNYDVPGGETPMTSEGKLNIGLIRQQLLVMFSRETRTPLSFSVTQLKFKDEN